jgi:CRP/FNR family nitrogen fixation transcriptional regulator
MLQTYSQTQARTALPSIWSSRPPVGQRPSVSNAATEGAEITVKRGDMIFDEGDDALYLYKLVSGSVRLARVMEEGYRQICDFILPGNLLGFESADEHEFSAQAIEDCVLVRYRRSSMAALISENGAFARDLQEMTANGLFGAYEHMLRLRQRSAKDRILWFLLAMSRRTRSPDVLHLPMNRCDIADYLGMAHETVSRVFTQLKKAGVIAEAAVNHIKILKPSVLRHA